MSKSTLPRLNALREEMGKAGITAFIIPGTDPHQSEYYATHWAARTWITGFNGSAGTAVVTTNQAGLWTDSRYFLQAAQQLEGSGFDLFKEGLPDTPTIEQWLLTTLPQGATIAIDGTLFGATKAATMKQNFERHGFRFVSDFTPFDTIWNERPSIPKNKIFIHEEKYSGESITAKMGRIMEQVHREDAEALLLAALDEIAWAFNIRGTDVECNPVVICYAYIDDSRRILFIDNDKIDETAHRYLQQNGVEILPYGNIFDFVEALPADKRVFVDSNKINYTLLNQMSAVPVTGQSPIALLKSVKNETQLLQGLKNRSDSLGLMKDQWDLKTPKILSSDEQKELTEYISQIEPAKQLEFIRKLGIATGQDAGEVLAAQMSDKYGLALALDLDAFDGSQNSAFFYLTGTQAIQEGQSLVKDIETNKTQGKPKYIESLNGLFDDPDLRSNVADTVTNVAAGILVNGETSSMLSAFRKAEKMVIGDVYEFRGRKIFTRNGRSDANIRERIFTLSNKLKNKKENVVQLPNKQKLTGEQFARDLATAQLRNSPDDNKFYVISGTGVVYDLQGNPFVIDIGG